MMNFVKCCSAQLPAVRKFWSEAYGPQHVLGRDAALFDWQFGPDAGGRPSVDRTLDCYHMKLAMDGQQVVGCLGFIPTEVMVRGEVLRGTWLANWMVAPQSARLGIGPLLLREVLREVDIIVNVGISEEARRILARMGWLDLGFLSRWVRPLQAQLANALLAESADGEWLPAVSDAKVPASFTVHQVQEFDEEAEMLWDRVWGAEKAGTRRSAPLLSWRYARHPRFRYELLEVREHDLLVGFAVYRVEAVRDLETLVGRIVELVASDHAVPALLAAVSQHAAARDVAVLDFYCASRRLDADLQAHGFQRGDSGRARHMPHLFQPLDRNRSGIACMVSLSGAQVPGTPDDWYATKGDADQDRPN